MKLFSTAAAVAALTLAASAPARADMLVDVLLDFENASGYFNTLPDQVVNGVAVTYGADAIGLVNDGTGNGVNGEFFTNAPSATGVLLGAGSDASINIGVGFVNSLSFFYSSSVAATDAVQIWSGLNGTGSLLASISLGANATSGCSDSDYCHFDQLVANFSGVAHSVTFSPAYTAAFDNVALQAVPEPATNVALLAGLGALGLVARRRRG
jgi:hypothetical protein